MAITAAARRGERRLVASPRRDSAARPVRVMVSTVVVVRSATPSLRTMALRRPIANAVRAIRAYRVPVVCGQAKATAAEAPTRTASAASVSRVHRRREPAATWAATRPPAAAPSRKQASEVAVCGTEKPGAPAAAKPRTTTLPVMFAVKTRPRPR